MEKREGNPLHEVPGSEARLTDEQLAAYNAAFQTIEGDLSTMRPVREALSRLEHVIKPKTIMASIFRNPSYRKK